MLLLIKECSTEEDMINKRLKELGIVHFFSDGELVYIDKDLYQTYEAKGGQVNG